MRRKSRDFNLCYTASTHGHFITFCVLQREYLIIWCASAPSTILRKDRNRLFWYSGKVSFRVPSRNFTALPVLMANRKTNKQKKNTVMTAQYNINVPIYRHNLKKITHWINTIKIWAGFPSI